MGTISDRVGLQDTPRPRSNKDKCQWYKIVIRVRDMGTISDRVGLQDTPRPRSNKDTCEWHKIIRAKSYS
jgi:hypothetical protein